jgi:hypothetical protein
LRAEQARHAGERHARIIATERRERGCQLASVGVAQRAIFFEALTHDAFEAARQRARYLALGKRHRRLA